jgi:hypothetical protein
MSVRSLQRRLTTTSRRLCDRAYERFAALVSGPMSPEDTAAASALFHRLTDWEADLGTPPEVMLARLPRGFADALRAALRKHLDATGQTRERGQSSANLMFPIGCAPERCGSPTEARGSSEDCLRRDGRLPSDCCESPRLAGESPADQC